jgi:two-component system cell cycle response regulator
MRLLVFQSITRLLIRKIVAIACLCALLVGALHTYLLYEDSKAHLNEAMATVGKVYVPQLATAVWDIEPENVEQIIHGIIQDNHHLAYAHLTLQTGHHFTAGQLADASQKQPWDFAIYAPHTELNPIGQLRVYPSAKAFYQLLLYNLLPSLLGYLMLTMLICQIVRWVLRQHLQRPLKEIAHFARTLDASKLLTPLKLSNRSNVFPNEIDAVVEGFDTLQAALSQHINQLDELVKVRTEQLEQALASIKQLYITDPLTACYNRNYLNDQLEMMLSNAAQQPFSLVFCDIDWFKNINDSYGHKAGDEVLAKVGEVLRTGLRTESDWVARYGGEEFLIVLPQTDLHEAVDIAERLRCSMTKLRFQLGGQAVSISASFGVAQQQQATETGSQLCERVDQLLYQAKHAGRNCVRSALDTGWRI